MLTTKLLAIIIPIAPDETQWQQLCHDFALLPQATEVIFVIAKGHDIDIHPIIERFPRLTIKLIRSVQGRAQQLNAGALAANNPYLWFLHADSRLTQHNIDALLNAIKRPSANQGLFYFDLYFYDKASKWLTLNEWGAKLRSNWLGIPFGDQGFAIEHKLFKQLGCYDITAPFGEDHLLVWQAKLQHVKCYPLGSPLATSARKYQQYGWLNLSWRYQILWPKQAWPHFKKLLAHRLLQSK
ncbi:glycosyltransferase [Psychrobium sp. 1_MG-2023]|uniref:glycosyltransferase n=1 Tax=Psychrobium sp. 1_MG-2023 TaxID=3062624 RepID=UPI002736D99D|nr:glycosyltransferase [Psychrobium sp. 1_MG-2023]MDP2560068.1 glycosyltransferase [Psychrobium sp. 1_MG-2023]